MTVTPRAISTSHTVVCLNRSDQILLKLHEQTCRTQIQGVLEDQEANFRLHQLQSQMILKRTKFVHL